MDDYNRGGHSKYSMKVHIIFVTKYRKKLFKLDKLADDVKQFLYDVTRKYEYTIIQMETDKDHVHILFRAHPNTEISKFINAYKSASSRLLKKEFPQIRQKLWKERFWSQSFCLLTTGGTPIGVLKKYIESQGEKERKRK